jgi:hypothetical protein
MAYLLLVTTSGNVAKTPSENSMEFGTHINGVWYTDQWSLVHVSMEFGTHIKKKWLRNSLYYNDLQDFPQALEL